MVGRTAPSAEAASLAALRSRWRLATRLALNSAKPPPLAGAGLLISGPNA